MGAQKVLQEIKNLQQWVDLYENVQKCLLNVEEFIQLAASEEDESFAE
jgi:hypothetical protein